MKTFVITALSLPLGALSLLGLPASPGARSAFGVSLSVASETATTFSLPDYLATRCPLVEDALSISLDDHKSENTKKITESMLYSLMAGGKRIRPILTYLTYDMFAPPTSGDLKSHYSPVTPAAVAIEMIHTMSLIHDDLPAMDDDDLRRGKPTNHVVYGEDVAILAGDALLSQSFETVSLSTPSSVDRGRVLEVVAKLAASVGATGLAGGQVMDLECEGKPSDQVTLDDLRWIHAHKTAALLKVCCSSGAILAGAGKEDVQRLEEFALKIGLAFQVADDILDVTADSATLGKTAGKDEAVDKATYPRLMGLDGARDEAERLAAEAKGMLEPFGEKADGLRAIADFIVNRSN